MRTFTAHVIHTHEVFCFERTDARVRVCRRNKSEILIFNTFAGVVSWLCGDTQNTHTHTHRSPRDFVNDSNPFLAFGGGGQDDNHHHYPAKSLCAAGWGTCVRTLCSGLHILIYLRRVAAAAPTKRAEGCIYVRDAACGLHGMPAQNHTCFVCMRACVCVYVRSFRAPSAYL